MTAENYTQTGLTSLSGAVKIPATFTYGGTKYKVSKLGDGLFAGNEDVTSVEIPDSVTEIGNEVFYYAAYLEKVTIPDSVTSIGNSAFEMDNAGALTSITIPDSVTYFGTNVFKGNMLIVINLPSGLTRLSDGMFRNCMGVRNLTIPDSVVSIGTNVFLGFGSEKGFTIKWRGKSYSNEAGAQELEAAIRALGS